MNFSKFKKICQKNDEENYLIDKYIYRKISIFGTMCLSRTNISPNTITLISLISCLGSLWFITQNSQFALCIGAFLVFGYHYLDHIDGELARYYIFTGKLSPSLRGQYFDVLCHSFSDNLMFLCMAWAVYQELGYTYVLWLGMIAMVGASGFPNFVAGKILIGKLMNKPALFKDEMFQSYLWAIELKKKQIESLNAPTNSSKWLLKLLAELIGYPGVLSAIVIVLLIDAAAGTQQFYGYQYNFRLIFLIISSALRILIVPRQFYMWMKKFEKIQ